MKFLHITCGNDSGKVLRGYKEHYEIISLMDDLSFGSLSDADEMGASRCQLWKNIWKAQWWITPDDEVKLSSQICEQKKKLRLLRDEVRPVVIWIGENPNDRLMLTMVAACLPLKTPLYVSNVASSPFMEAHKYSSVSMCSHRLLQSVTPRKLTLSKRSSLQKQWQDWKDLGEGWRDIDRYGCLVEYPIHYLDTVLLDELSTISFKSANDIVQKLVKKFYVSEHFIFWRLSLLNENGNVFLPKFKDTAPSVIKLM